MSGVFGWDYPPGVTGMEPEIAGCPECPDCEGSGEGEEPTDEEKAEGHIAYKRCERCRGTGSLDPYEEME